LCIPDINSDIRAKDVMALAETELSAPTTVVKEATPKPGAPETAQQTEIIETTEALASVAPANEPARHDVATPDDISQALKAFASDAQPTTAADALVRGILPILNAWNSANDQQYDHLVKAIHDALYAEEKAGLATTPPSQPPELVD